METWLCLVLAVFMCIYAFGAGFLHLLYFFFWGLAEFEFMCFGEPGLISFVLFWFWLMWSGSQGKQ